ncbi:MAG: hypothetical protein QOH67_4706, partial [Hyphomicrobiales bacterium]|nr:hypothetical protein [Hyphomicrobiales bacterium]
SLQLFHVNGIFSIRIVGTSVFAVRANSTDFIFG